MYAQESRFPLFTVEEVRDENDVFESRQSPQLSLITEVLIEADPAHKSENTPKEVKPTIPQSLSDIFPEQQFDRQLRKVSQILGPLTKCYSKYELQDLIVEIQFLCESWLDEYERKIFEGMTLQEFIHEKGAL